MATLARTHLLFVDGGAEKALDFYDEVFDEFKVEEIERYGPDSDGEGSVKVARFSLAGTEFTCADSPGVSHDFSFTPAVSLWVDCASDDELEATFAKLSDDGDVLMPLDDYGFSTRYGWVNDRFGVSWQLNLP